LKLRVIFTVVLIYVLSSSAQGNTNEPDAIVSNKYPRLPIDSDENYQKMILDEDHKILKLQAEQAEKNNNENLLVEILKNIIELEIKYIGKNSIIVASKYFKISRIHKAQGKFEDALKSALICYKINKSVLGDEDSITMESHSIIARILSDLDRNAEALGIHKQIFELSRKTLGAAHIDTIDAQAFVGLSLLQLGRFHEALDVFKQNLELKRKVLGDEHPDIISDITAYALTLMAVGRYDEALQTQSQVVALAQRALGEKNQDTLQTMFFLGLTKKKMGLFHEAYEIDTKVLELYRGSNGDSKELEAQFLQAISLDLLGLGRFQEALEIQKQLLDLNLKAGDVNEPLKFESFKSLSEIFSAFDRRDEALRFNSLVLERYRERLGEEHPFTLTQKMTRAQLLFDLSRYEEAMELSKQVLDIRHKVLGDEHPDTLEALQWFGSTLLMTERYDEAVVIQDRALQQSKKTLGDTHKITVQSMMVFAFSLNMVGREDESFKLLEQGIQIFRKSLGKRHPETLAAMDLATTNLLISDYAPAALVYARALYDESIRAIGTMDLLDVRNESLPIPWVFKADYVSYRFADALWSSANDKPLSRGMREEAFAALQRGSLGITSKAIASSAAIRYASSLGVGELASRQRQLINQGLNIEKQSMDAISSLNEADIARRKILDIRSEEIRTEVRAINKMLEKRAPQYFSILQQAPLRISETRKLLKNNEAVLIISPTTFGTHIIALNDREIIWKRSELDRDDIAKLVRQLRQDLDPASTAYARGPDLSLPGASAMPSFDRKSAHDLYVALIQPVEELIKGSSQVFIVADGALASLPLGVLVTKEPLTTENDSDPDVLRRTSWLADTYPIVQLPSLQSLSYLRTYNQLAAKQPAGTSFLGFGDPLLGGASFERGSRSASLPTVEINSLTGSGVTATGSLLMDTERLRALPRLPGTARELESVRQSLNAPASSVRVTMQMTESAIKAGNLKDVGILHLATHGLTAAQSGSLAEPGLVFTPPQRATSQDDGYLSSSEVIGLDLTMTDWVILSACNTAAASGKDGETGLSGLARSFFYAGASTLLVSHWPVDDDVAAKITTSTIGYSRSGMSRSQALQKAMKDIRTSADPRLAHPSVWAPFSILGDGR